MTTPTGHPNAESAPSERPSGVTSSKVTPLLAVHERLGATLTDFAGWRMPLRYGSESAEHLAVRTAAGLFDLSHMGEIDVTGPDGLAALNYSLVSDFSRLAIGRAKYSMLCREDGGVLDDVIVYRLGEEDYLVVANAANVAVVTEALTERAAKFDATVADRSADYALLAVQGPRSVEILAGLTDADLDGMRYYSALETTVAGVSALVARTGYTGEDGFELLCAPHEAEHLWEALMDAGRPYDLAPAGLSCRDTLRLEAGMPLYGNELSVDVTPFEAGLGRVVALDKSGGFVGHEALTERAATGPRAVLIGLVSKSRRVPRHGYPVVDPETATRVGTVTSGAPSPTLGTPIAMAYVEPGSTAAGGRLAVDIRGRLEEADVIDLPFYRRSR